MRLSFLLVSAAFTAAAPASEGKFRCRDRDPMCSDWNTRGECANNYAFMAETCPRSCGMCEESGFLPTPAPFQLDFVCKDQLSIAPKTFKSQNDEGIPEGCTFRCRDNMTEICTKAAAEGLCDKEAATMRFQCPQTCGVCKGLGLAGGGPYPKHACRLETGDDPEHESSCGNWAASGECVKNFGFMSLSCEKSCGLCALSTDGGALPRDYNAILRPPPPPRVSKTKKGKKGKGKKKRSTVSEGGSGSSEGGNDEATAAEATEAGLTGTESTPSEPSTKSTEAAEPAPAAEAEKPAAKAAAAADTTDVGSVEPSQANKKKGWYSKAKEAVGSALKGKAKASAKDEM